VLCIVKGTRRHRYIDFHIDSKEQIFSISNSEFLQALRQQTFMLFSKNLKDLRLWVVQFDGTQGVLKCHYTEKEHIIQLLLSIKKIGTKPVSITTRSTSGTIRGLGNKKQTNGQ
jgi:RNase P/RNase MRP subunit POP5